MFARTADELTDMMACNPGTSPSTFLMDNSFAAWCYDNKSLSWLKAAFNRDADVEECRRWRISPAEWKACVEMAAIALSVNQAVNQ